jgi:hypothetical protein
MHALDPTGDGICARLLQSTTSMQKNSLLLLVISCLLESGCIGKPDDTERVASSVFTASTQPITTVVHVGSDTLSDSVRIDGLEPEPDGQSIAFLFADPAKGITRGLAIVQSSGAQQPQLVWPDSVTSFWWSGAHQLSFIAGTGHGVRVVVNAHAAELEALDATGSQHNSPPGEARSIEGTPRVGALARAQEFIDSVRIQPTGTPQRSVLRYQPDTVLIAPGDTLAAVHVSADMTEGAKVNPAWYLIHLPSRHVVAIDSLTGRSSGLLSSAGRWGSNGVFYYAKEQSIWQARPSVK